MYPAAARGNQARTMSGKSTSPPAVGFQQDRTFVETMKILATPNGRSSHDMNNTRDTQNNHGHHDKNHDNHDNHDLKIYDTNNNHIINRNHDTINSRSDTNSSRDTNAAYLPPPRPTVCGPR